MTERRRTIQCLVTLSYDPDVTAAEARRELRERVNGLRCHTFDEQAVKVKKISPPPVRR